MAKDIKDPELDNDLDEEEEGILPDESVTPEPDSTIQGLQHSEPSSDGRKVHCDACSKNYFLPEGQAPSCCENPNIQTL